MKQTMQKWTIGRTLNAAFLGAATIILLLGSVGYYGAVKNTEAIAEIGGNALPSVDSLRLMSQRVEGIQVAARTLAIRGLPLTNRSQQYPFIATARADYEAASKIYELLPQTLQEGQAWNQFVPVEKNWQLETDKYLDLCQQFDRLGIVDPVELERNLQGFTKDHYRLETKVLLCLQYKQAFAGGDDDTACAFGHWLPAFKTDNPELSKAVQDTVESHRQFHAAVKTIKQLVADGKVPEAQAVFEQQMAPAAEKVFKQFELLTQTAGNAIALQDRSEDILLGSMATNSVAAMGWLDKVIQMNNEVGTTESKKSISRASQLKVLSLTAMIMGVVGALFMGGLITRNINRTLKGVANDLNMGAEQTSAAAAQVSASSQSLAEGASEQASSLEETSASLEEMASMTKRNAENARQASELAKEAREAADKGMGDMQIMANAMEAIKLSSDDIAKIIKTIDEIAFQTNILALNAAVEAARAGEAGMGFAVVADEVRNLAQRCAHAAKETSGKIEGAIVRTAEGVEISGKVAEALHEIVTRVHKVDKLVTDVANASREQTEGIAQVNTAVTQMDKVTQTNAANAEESAAAAEQLNSQATVMKQSVAELLALVSGRNKTTKDNPVAEVRCHSPVQRAAARTIPFLPPPQRSGIVAWNEEKMATGFAAVDSQHKELIKRINELHADCIAGKAREELMEHLNFLGSYAQSHFGHEEKIMAEHRCPSMAQNLAAHAKFLKDYKQVVAMVKADGATTKVALQLKQMLGDWLTTHICRIDTGLRSCTAAHPVQPISARNPEWHPEGK